MAIVLRRNVGTALTYDQLDDNFVDYTEFRDKFDQSSWTGSSDGYVLYFDNPTGKIKLKELSASDISAAFGTNFNSHFALKTTSDLSEGTNLYYTTTRFNSDFDSRLATKSTTNLSEGSNKYYTDARVLTKINATSIKALSDIPNTASSDNAKVLTYDLTTDSFKYSSLLTESLLPVTDHGLITDGDVVTGSTGVTTTTLQALTNVNFTSVATAVDGNVLVYDGTASEWKAGVVTSGGGAVNTGVTTFKALTDTPANYSGSAGKYVKVNSGETGIEYDTLTTDDIAEGTAKFYTNSRFDTRLATKTTDDLPEGSSNTYYTNTRADGRIALHIGANLNLGSKTTNDLAEGSGNLYYTEARANSAIDAKLAVTTLATLSDVESPSGPSDNGKLLMYRNDGGSINRYELTSFASTSALPEGTNLYYTNARADNRIAAASINALADVDTTGAANNKILKYNGTNWVVADDGGTGIDYTDLSVGAEGTPGGNGAIAYNNSTGVFTFTPPTLAGLGGIADLTGQALTSISDVSVVAPSDDGKVLYYNHGSTNFQWKSLSSINDLADVDTTGIANAKILKYDSGSSKWVVADDLSGASGVTEFTALTDTPTTYSASAGKYLKVNSSGNGVEFDSLSTSDVPEGTRLYYTDTRFDSRLASKNTDQLSEGSSNLYYTDTRADARVSVGFGTKSTDDLSEGSSNLYYTDARADARVTAGFSAKSTSNLNEGTNLYYTNARADARIGAAGLADLGNVATPGASDNGKILYYDHSSFSFKWKTDGGGGGTSYDQSLNTTDSVTFAGVTTSNFTVNGSGTVNFTGTDLTFTASNRAKVSGAPFRLARMTTTQRNAITSPEGGDMIFNTTTSKFQGYNGTSWVDLH
tara:strand:- start:3858 stop:6473 length:2616 start_codon:yes stop_codon:yes gene_type:complete